MKRKYKVAETINAIVLIYDGKTLKRKDKKIISMEK